MTDFPQDPIKRFINSRKAHRAYVDFERNITIAFHTIMGIINKTERLRALVNLRNEAIKTISEIAKLEDFRGPDLISNFKRLSVGDNKIDDWSDFEGNAVEPPIDLENAKEKRKRIYALLQHIIPINEEITRLRIIGVSRKPDDNKSIDRRFMGLFKDPSKAIDTIQLLRDGGAIDKDQKWIGISNPKKKGEIKLIWSILNTYGLLKESLKETPSVRIFYQRFNYAETFNERILRQEIKDVELREQYKKLFMNLLKT